MRRMRVVVCVACREIDVRAVRVCMRMHVRVTVVIVGHNPSDRCRVPVGVILEREVQRHDQRFQHETHADNDPQKSLHRRSS